MKLSLRWIFDHIDADWRKIDIVDLVDRFNKTTAEIEGFEKYELDLGNFGLVQVKEVGSDSVQVFCKEWNKTIEVPARNYLSEGGFYLIKRSIVDDKESYTWAKVSDFGCPKEGYVPALFIDESLAGGNWKKSFEKDDYIIEVDNKSITHRPDMWGHRGFAREVAAIYDLPFISSEEFLTPFGVKEFKDRGQDGNGFHVHVENPDIGKRFAGLYIPKIRNRQSSLWMASRLMRVGSRPIDFIVDVTNYVMQDLSQPMHAFDVNKLAAKTIVPRLAKKGEKLELLDDVEIELTNKDYVITDGKKPIALAGVMGGRYSGIDSNTNAIFIESANFQAASVRNSAIWHKTRTESSSRFEKTLDPNQNIDAIFRLLKLFDDENITYTLSDYIISVGPRAQELEITIEHVVIEKLLGATILPEFVLSVFKKLEFKVEQIKTCNALVYRVIVPTCRSSKDIEIKEDLVEEIGRFFGYENTDYVLPKKETTPYKLQEILCPRKIKRVCSYGLKMREVKNYPFYDESFLAKLQWEPKQYKEVANPVSENWKKLVTSLIPHLLKNVEQNCIHYDQLRFFEWARTWHHDPKTATKDAASYGGTKEKKALAGIFYDKKQVDFYCAKSWVMALFDLLDMQVRWEKADQSYVSMQCPWYFVYQTAKLICNDVCIGYAGKLNPEFFSKLFDGDLFAFELDGEFLVNYKPSITKLTPISRYPEVIRDVSMFVPLAVTVEQVKNIILFSDEKIKSAHLLDFFQKDEWNDKKSLTFRFIMQDYNKTLEKEEVDAIYDLVSDALKKVGAEIR